MNNRHVPIVSPRQGGRTICLTDSQAWPCSNVDAYQLPLEPPDGLFDGVPNCELVVASGHTWGPWVLSPVYANREDRFCLCCGAMEMQTL